MERPNLFVDFGKRFLCRANAFSTGSHNKDCPSIINYLVICNNFFPSAYDALVGRTPKARRDSYGAWLHHLRTEKGLSQDALCEIIGVSQSTWAYWERTGKFVGRDVILKTAKALDVSVEELLRVDHAKKP